MYTVWGSTSIQVPSQMIAETRFGSKLRDTLTKRGNIATNKGVKAFILTRGTGHTNILDQGTRLNLNNLQTALKEEKKLFKNRKSKPIEKPDNKIKIDNLKKELKEISNRVGGLMVAAAIKRGTGGGRLKVVRKEEPALRQRYKKYQNELKELTGEEYPDLQSASDFAKESKKYAKKKEKEDKLKEEEDRKYPMYGPENKPYVWAKRKKTKGVFEIL